MVDRKTYERMMARTIEDGDCLVWQGPDRKGLPHYHYREGDGKYKLSVRREIYLYNAKIIKPGYRVMTTCNTPLCVNPAHLKATSPSVYSRSIRNPSTPAKLSRIAVNREKHNFRIVLDMEKATQIRMSEKPAKELADEYGVSLRAIQDVLNYATWNRNNMFSGLIR